MNSAITEGGPLNFEHLIIERRGPIWLVTINRPEKRNALNRAMLAEFGRLVDDVALDSQAAGLIVTGCENSFMSGTDIGYLQERTVRETEQGVVQNLYTRLENLPCPVIAAVNGWALGGGCELALAADIRIASENAVFGLPEVGLGMLPGAGGTQRLTRLVGHGRAMEIILTGRRVPAEEALAIGLANRVVTRERLRDEALGMMEQIAAKGPLAVRLAKEAVRAFSRQSLAQGLDVERLAQTILFQTRDRIEGIQAYFERRPPEFHGE